MPYSPFTDDSSAAIRALGETALLAKIQQWLGAVNPPAPYGMGDDAAVLPEASKPPNLFTTDSLVYGRHFDSSVPPQAAGAKLLKRSLSDIAAMAGRPHRAVLAALLPAAVRIDWLENFYAGLCDVARAYEVAIVGGDIAETSSDLAVNLTLLGEASRPILRCGARVGDRLYVTGELGGSLLGKHLDFVPRLAEGRWLAQWSEVSAMIDLTDGLAKDLPALLPPQTCAGLDPSALPISTAAHHLAAGSGRRVLDLALGDGEDYELLFALRPEIDPVVFSEQWQSALTTPLTEIGEILPQTKKPDSRLVDRTTGAALTVQGGFEHFR